MSQGGCLVGASLNNKRVLIIDDVITAGLLNGMCILDVFYWDMFFNVGTAIRESLSLLSGRSGVGAIVAGSGSSTLNYLPLPSALYNNRSSLDAQVW